MAVEQLTLSDAQFERFAKFVYDRAGIYLAPAKKSLLANRLRRRQRALKLDSFDDYYNAFSDGKFAEDELPHFLNAVTTNETYFFRNTALWRLFTDKLLPEFRERHAGSDRTVRVWSAASSSGEEAYTVGIVLRENLPESENWRIQIVGSDISRNVLEKAQQGLYGEYAVSKMPAAQRQRWFIREGEQYQVKDEVRKLVRFQFHNLRNPFPQGNFDLVLLRNVLLYFDTPMKQYAIQHASAAVAPGGYLYIGDVDPTRTSKELMAIMKLEVLTPGLYRRPPKESALKASAV